MTDGALNNPARDLALTIVIPARDEAERLGTTLERIETFLRAEGRAAEIIIVDDSSLDATREIAERFLALHPELGRIIHAPVPGGKGAAVRAGVLSAVGRRVLVTDADLSTPMPEIAKLERELDAGAAIAIGSRDVPGSNVQVRQAAYRERMGRVFNMIIRAIGLTRFRDTQCGFKLYDGDTARAVFAEVRLRHFAYDVEALMIAEQMGAQIVEVAVLWRNDPHSTVHLVRDSARMLWDVARLRLRG